MDSNKQIRIRPEVVKALLDDEVKLAQVSVFTGITRYTLRYRWLRDPNDQTTTPSLIFAIAKYFQKKESEITEEYFPIKTTSTIN